MRIIVTDLELNSPEMGYEIIQIGAVTVDLSQGTLIGRVDDTGEIFKNHTFNEFLKPSQPVDPRISELCCIKHLDLLEIGKPQAETLDNFWKFVGNKPVVAWGYDVKKLLAESHIHGCKEIPKRVQEIDLKALSILFRQALPNTKRKGGLKNTMDAFGLEFIGQQHDAYWDAYNTAQLMLLWFKKFKNQLAIEAIISGSER